MDQQPVTQDSVPTVERKSKKGALLAIVALIILAGLGGLWYKQIKDYQVKQSNAEKKVSNLEKQIKDLKNKTQSSDSDAITSLTVPSDKDIKEINKALAVLCGKDMIFTVSDASGKVANTVTKDLFNKVGTNGDPNFYKNTAIINISCREKTSSNEGGGGFIAVLQRQADSSWKKVLGVQDTPSCETIKQYAISKVIFPTCIDAQGAKEVPNTVL